MIQKSSHIRQKSSVIIRSCDTQPPPEIVAPPPPESFLISQLERLSMYEHFLHSQVFFYLLLSQSRCETF